MLDVLCWLAGLVVLTGCLSPRSPGKPVRNPSAPWMLLYRDGSWRVDMDHPEWQRRFRKTLEACERIRTGP